MRTYKEIEEWFKQQSWYSKYKKYYKAQNHKEFKVTDIPWYQNLVHPFITSMFHWCDTEEGCQFWEKQCDSFQDWFKAGTSPDPRSNITYMTAEEQERENIINWTEKQLWFKAFIKNIEFQNMLSFRWPKSYDTTNWSRERLILDAFIWNNTAEGHDFWRKICEEFTIKYSEGFFKSPVKPTKIDPKTFSMVRKRENKYKLKYKL